MTLILESEAARSLTLTRVVASVLREHEWLVTEGACYSGGAIDVAAKRTWASGGLTAGLRLAAFCVASSPDQHLLFCETPHGFDAGLPRFSRGDDDATQREAIRQTLVRYLDAPASEDVLQTMHAAAYPNGVARSASASVVAPAARACASGFREIDDRGRAASGGFALAVADAFSSADAVCDDLLHFQLEGIGDDLDVEVLPERQELASSILVQATSRCELVHPVVVTDAPLSILGDAAKTTERPWLRLLRSSLIASAPRWIDIVHEEAFPRYASTVTRHYDAHYKRRKFNRL